MSELTEWLITPNPPIEAVALTIAREGGRPSLDEGHYRRELDRLAAPLRRHLTPLVSLDQQVSALRACFYEELGFRCDDEAHEPRNFYLDEVLERRQGAPLTLGIVLQALGERTGLRIQSIARPQRLLWRVGGQAGELLDPLDGGRSVAIADLERTSSDPANPPLRQVLTPLDARETALRLLRHLLDAHTHHDDHARALLVCDGLVDLTNAPDHRRDRGLHALALGRHQAAAADLVAYLTERPDALDAPRMRRLLAQALAAADTLPD